MTSRERVLCALSLKEPDRVPYCEASVDPAIAHQILGGPGEPDLSGATRYKSRPVEEEKEISRALHRDNISFQMRAPFFAKEAIGKDGRTFYGEGLIQSEEDLKLIELPDPHNDEFYEEAIAFAEAKEDFAAAAVTRLGVSSVLISMGVDGFSYALYENRGLLDEVLRIFTEWEAVVIERLCKIGFDLVWAADDIAFGTGPFFSPRVFREVIIPHLMRAVDKITLPWIYHSDGNLLPLIEDLLGLGMSGLHPIEPDAMDINYIKEHYGRRVCLVGNTDLNTLTLGAPEDVEEEVKTRIRDVAPGGGYIASSGNSLAAYCKLENVYAMSGAIQKYGKYPID